jgi:hypothetical protein
LQAYSPYFGEQNFFSNVEVGQINKKLNIEYHLAILQIVLAGRVGKVVASLQPGFGVTTRSFGAKVAVTTKMVLM